MAEQCDSEKSSTNILLTLSNRMWLDPGLIRQHKNLASYRTNITNFTTN